MGTRLEIRIKKRLVSGHGAELRQKTIRERIRALKTKCGVARRIPLYHIALQGTLSEMPHLNLSISGFRKWTAFECRFAEDMIVWTC